MGGLVVIRNATNIAIPAGNSYVQDTEYWIYASSNIDGITDSANPPGPLNLDWIRVYNIPLSAAGEPAAENMDAQGAFAIYEKRGSTYQLQNYFTVPNAASGRRLGNKVEFRETGADSYKLFVHAKGDGTEHNQGRIYIIEKNATEDWSLGIDRNFRGFQNTNIL